MLRLSLLGCLLAGLLLTPAEAQSAPAAAPAGGQVHGTIKAGNVPLPGVSVVATNTLTGQRYATITDINGNYSMTIPVNGRYVVKAELAAFAPETKVALIKPTTASPVNQQADFALTLASRVPPETPQESAGRPLHAHPRRAPCGAIPAQEPRILPCSPSSRARPTPELAPVPPEQPCPPSPTTPTSPPTRLPLPAKQARPIPLPVSIWSSFVRTQSWISRLPAAAARAVLEVAADKEVAPVEADPAAAEADLGVEEVVLAAEAEVSAEGEAAAAGVAADSATSATSSPTSPMARSFGQAETLH